MPPSAESRHTFIVRVWLEPRELEGSPPVWRGEIEHVPDGEHRYVATLHDMADFIVGYLRQMGVRVSLLWLLRPRSLRRKPGAVRHTRGD
jgi:hypothetical protein